MNQDALSDWDVLVIIYPFRRGVNRLDFWVFGGSFCFQVTDISCVNTAEILDCRWGEDRINVDPPEIFRLKNLMSNQSLREPN